MNKSLTLAIVLLVVLSLAAEGQAKYYWKRYKHMDTNNQINVNVGDNKPSEEYAADTCNITHFQFQSNYSLGKQDELNRTFTKLGEKITALDNVTYKANDTATYTIFEANPTFVYRDTKQRAQIVGNDTIVIEGGQAEVVIDFKWRRTGSQTYEGTGRAIGLSEPIIFAKALIFENDFFKYDLLDYLNVTFTNHMPLVRVTPADISDDDKAQIDKLVNNIINVTTLRHELQNDIALYYPFYLKMNLHDDTHPIDEYFEYHWVDPIQTRGNLTIPFIRRPAFIDIEKEGIHYGYEARIKDYANWTCGAMPPILPLNPKVYGGSQQFISYSFYQNVLKYAVSTGHMDTPLNKDLWQNRMFQFYAGDLYEIFPLLAQKYVANLEVTGNCKASRDHILVLKDKMDTFNVTIHVDCQLNVAKQKIHNFAVGLTLVVQGQPGADSMNFTLKDHQEFVSFYEYGQYKMQNEALARLMIHHSINRMYQGSLFGSGWPLHPPRDYPHFLSQVDATVVYDSTHVDPKYSSKSE